MSNKFNFGRLSNEQSKKDSMREMSVFERFGERKRIAMDDSKFPAHKQCSRCKDWKYPSNFEYRDNYCKQCREIIKLTEERLGRKLLR